MVYRYQDPYRNDPFPWGCLAVPVVIVAIIGAVIYWYYSARFIDNRPPKPPVRAVSHADQCMYSNGSRLIVAEDIAKYVPPGECYDRILKSTGRKVGGFCTGDVWMVNSVVVPEAVVKDTNSASRHLQVIGVITGHDYTTGSHELTCDIRNDSVLDADTGEVIYAFDASSK